MAQFKVNSSEETVYILLATRQGEPYLAEQLTSLVEQSWKKWKLLIRDDSSKDRTPQVLAAFLQKESRAQLLQDQEGRLGVVKNFARLMEKAFQEGARYILLSDQDDIWLPRKIEKEMALMKQAEKEHGSETPLLIHSDLTVVDKKLNLIHKSFMRYQKIHHKPEKALQVLLVQNFVTGCTTLFNRPLLKIALPIPDCAPIHDWWIALCAASAGKLLFLPEPTVLYRQHEENAIGSKSFWRKETFTHLSEQNKWATSRQNFIQNISQVEDLLKRSTLVNHIKKEDIPLLHLYSQLPKLKPLDRLALCLKLKVIPYYPWRALLFFSL